MRCQELVPARVIEIRPMLTRDQARQVYDRWGARQDSQSRYEELPLGHLIRQGAFREAEFVLELGCGTGAFARQLLEEHLPASARYLGLDLSRTMIELTRRRIAKFGARAQAVLTDGSMSFPVADSSCDRIVANYVLDLLSEHDLEGFVQESHRALSAQGRLCMANLTHGTTFPSRLVSAAWGLVQRLAPRLVGGCRPLDARRFLDPHRWHLEFDRIVVAACIPSQVIVASRVDNPLGRSGRSDALWPDSS